VKNIPYVLMLLVQFLASNCPASGHEDRSYSEISSWWRAIYPSLHENIARFNAHEIEDLKKFRNSVNNLGQKAFELDKSFERSLSLDRQIIKNIKMYCNAVREVESLADPADHLFLSMALGLEYSTPVTYFYKNVKTENGDHIRECDDAKL
jgi:hypothetical protein